jgi:hypothetical protein
MGSDSKPRTADGYDAAITDACETALLTLLGAFGTLGDDLRLIGGLAPRYLTPEKPPEVPAHAGTTDVDVVLDLAVISQGHDYGSLASQLEQRGFQRYVKDGRPSSWQWQLQIGSIPVLVELLSDGGNATRPQQVPLAGEDVSTLAMPHAGIARDWCIAHELTGEPLGGGLLTRKIYVADVPAFILLKALALNKRYEPKDAADLIHVLAYAGTIEDIAGMFVERKLSNLHEHAMEAGLEALRFSFVHPSRQDRSHACDGPVKYASFRYSGTDEDARVEAQRYAAHLVGELLREYERRLRDANEAAHQGAESSQA